MGFFMSCTAYDTAAKATKGQRLYAPGGNISNWNRWDKKEKKKLQMQDFNPKRWAIKWKYK